MKKAYIGIDSHKENNLVAVALAGRGDPELYGKAPADDTEVVPPGRARERENAGCLLARREGGAKTSTSSIQIRRLENIFNIAWPRPAGAATGGMAAPRWVTFGGP